MLGGARYRESETHTSLEERNLRKIWPLANLVMFTQHLSTFYVYSREARARVQQGKHTVRLKGYSCSYWHKTADMHKAAGFTCHVEQASLYYMVLETAVKQNLFQEDKGPVSVLGRAQEEVLWWCKFQTPSSRSWFQRLSLTWKYLVPVKSCVCLKMTQEINTLDDYTYRYIYVNWC